MNKNLKLSLAAAIMLCALFFCVHTCDSFISEGRTQNLIEENAQLRKEIDILREFEFWSEQDSIDYNENCHN